MGSKPSEPQWEFLNICFLKFLYCCNECGNEYVHIFLAEGLTPGETCFDENEAIDIEEMDLDTLFHMAMSGEIEDAKTLIAIFMVRALTAAEQSAADRKE